MNAARMYRRLKRDIGVYGIALPIDNVDEYIQEIIEDTTIPTFSIYVPRKEYYVCTMDQFERGKNETGDGCDLYLLPSQLFEGRELLYVRRVEYATDVTEYYARYAGGMSRSTMATGVSALTEMMLANADKPIIDMSINPVTFKYEYPRKLYIYDATISSRLKLTLACEHDTSLQTIPPTAAESFHQLATLDVKAGLYNLVKMHEEIKGAYDSIELKIDDWRGAAEKREALIEKWDELYGLDQGSYDFG